MQVISTDIRAFMALVIDLTLINVIFAVRILMILMHYD
jgi:hypothetical protein